MYEYEKDPIEVLAEAVLKTRGWSVTPPQCPLCYGWGTVPKTDEQGWSWSSERCPNGCPLPTMIL